MEELLVEQRAEIRAIGNTVTNYNKLALVKRTRAVTEGRLQLLLERCERCRKLDIKINVVLSDDEREEDYFVKKEFDAAEDAFTEAYDFLCEKIAAFKLPSGPSEHSSSINLSTAGGHAQAPVSSVKLPQIELPKFSGCYTEWNDYRNLFDTLINQNESLNNVQRLHYLKLSLSGEAARLIQHVKVTEANFNTAWDSLVETYDDERAIMDAYFHSFLSMPTMTTESAKELKNLRDKTNEALSCLKNLGCPTETWSQLIVYLTVQKLDRNSASEWEMQLGSTSTYPTFDALVKFLSARIRFLEKIETKGKPTNKIPGKSKGSSQPTEVRSHSTTTGSLTCILCENNHALHKCESFKSQSAVRRKEIAREKDCCFNCLRQGHRPRACPSKHTCFQCKKKHHTLLHQDPSESSSPTKLLVVNASVEPKSPPSSEPSVSNIHHAQKSSVASRFTLLATAIVNLRSANGRSVRARALLDQGSQSTLIKESIVQALRPKRHVANALVNGVGGVEIGTARQRVNLHVESCNDPRAMVTISALVLPRLTHYTPKGCTSTKTWPHLHGLLLADPDPSSNEPIDLIIGADYYGSILRPGLRQGSSCAPIAQQTLFGWILSGQISLTEEHPASIATHNCITSEDLHADLARFWEIEESPRTALLTDDEKKCETHFATTHRRLIDGRYMVRLPFKDGPPIDIGESFTRASSMLNTVVRRLKRDSSLCAEYNSFLNEYETLGHMRRVPLIQTPETAAQCVYLPHHPVVRESSSTTRVRVVFNASSVTSNATSLNDHLLVGPKLQLDITAIILRWRAYCFVYTAEIAKMFRQILVDPRDVDYQRILWQRETDTEIAAYQLLTVTYGTASAPYLANRVLQQLADDEGREFPLAEPIVRKNFYVDDVLFGADSVETARETREQLIQLMERGGLHLRKWSANTEELLADSSSEGHELASALPLSEIESLNVLGITWNPKRDAFQFKLNLVAPPSITKRVVLSIIARLYDPLGWAAPIIIVAKLFMQELWVRKLEWDSKLPEDLVRRWELYYQELPRLGEVAIPRWTGQSPAHNICEIHGFADASTRAYAAVVYIRVLRDIDDARVTLLIAKTKVAPITPVSVPRSELCAAVLLARLLRKIIDDLNLTAVPIYGWSDSAVTLHWLKKHPSNWKTFVANRVAEISTLLPSAIWRHVPTKENPADCASRGLAPAEAISHQLWWTGPPWLTGHSTFWPSDRVHASKLADLEERKQTHSHAVLEDETPARNLPDLISSWPRLLRITAYCLRFIKKARAATRRVKPTHTGRRSESIGLTSDEFGLARDFWIKNTQAQSFSRELQALSRSAPLASSSRLRSLNPFIDDKGILRVGGRLSNAPLSYDEKHPIILPRSRLSELIAEQTHLRALNGGSLLTLKLLRQNFWILRDRSLVKRLIRECIVCVRERAARPSQLMGDLPSARVTASSRPFLHSGVDYAGPISVRLTKGRGHQSQKAYVALFICLSTRAVHLELVSDYATSGFLAAFRRFAARRGIPTAMYSDNGTNFQGADKELRNALKLVSRDADLRSQLVSDGTDWHFIPPSAPHFGGLWESGVKSVKHHLKRIVGAHTLTFEELTTLLTQIESCLNSRPIAPLSNDPDDLTCLTPGHFLIGGPLLAIPTPSVLEINENRLSRWQLVQQKLEHFWRRWSQEYLHSVQQRNKWLASQPELKVGDLVLLRNEQTPPSKWRLGRVVECHPGRDNHVRVVTVKTANSVLKRPIVQLCLLPVHASSSSDE